MRALVYHGPVSLAAVSCARLMRLVTDGQHDVGRSITHHFGIDDFEQACEVFGDPGSGALKVVLTRDDDGEAR